MDLDNKDIQLIEQYLLGQLSGESLQAFEQRMEDDPAFAEEVALYRDVIKGVEKHGRQDMKAGLAAMMAKVDAGGAEMQEYEPAKQPKHKSKRKGKGSGGGRFLGSILLVGGAVLLYLWQTGQWHQVESLWEELPEIKPTEIKQLPPKKEEPKVVYEIKRDTIVQEKRETTYIKKKVEKQDTVWNLELQPELREASEYGGEVDFIPETTYIQKEFYDTLAVPN